MFHPAQKTIKTIRQLQRNIHFVKKGTQNVLKLLFEGRFTIPYHSPFMVVYEEPVFKLRRYLDHGDVQQQDNRPAILLIPPLMLASEIYDMSPELSAVSFLKAQGADVWLVDFGAPEMEKNGMKRTLDDHIVGVSHAVDHVHTFIGKDIHLAGYSQGGIFAYLTAAYRNNKGILSVITFGSPVDIHRNIPNIRNDVAQHIIQKGSSFLTIPIKFLNGISGALSSTGFKLLSAQKEIRHFFEFFTILHDRDALKRRETQRRFLGGEGFVAWPGPAMRKFVDDMVIHNRMFAGGLIINGIAISLSAIKVPILYFVGSRDTFGRPASVRAIQKAAVNAKIFEMELHTGHFGLVVGTKSLNITWPVVFQWMDFLDNNGDAAHFSPMKTDTPLMHLPFDNNTSGPIYDIASDMIDSLWNHAGNAWLELSEMIDVFRWQLPRLAKIWQLKDKAGALSIAQLVSDQSKGAPGSSFLLWEGHAYTYGKFDSQVNQLVTALVQWQFSPGMHVGIYMNNHPNFLISVVALNRIGAVAVLLNQDLRGQSLNQALMAARVEKLIIDPNHVQSSDQNIDISDIYIYGNMDMPIPDHMVHLDRHVIADLEQFESPYPLNPGFADDLAMLIFTSGTTGLPKPVKISNRRWCLAALASAAGGNIKPGDTIYCCLPLYHASAMLTFVGGAIIAGSRLVIAKRFSANSFMDDIRKYGVTVVGYIGEMCRYLISLPSNEKDKQHSVRLFMGNGMQQSIWESILERYQPSQVIEFYASTEGNMILANLSGKKVGSVGRPVYDPGRIMLIQYDIINGKIIRDSNGKVIPCKTNEAGVLIARIDKSHPVGYFDGYLDDNETQRTIINDVFSSGDSWFVSGDLLKRDKDGDFWYVDRIGDTFRWKSENISTKLVETVLGDMSFVANAAVYGVKLPKREGRIGVAALELKPEMVFDGQHLYTHVDTHLSKSAHPRVVRIVSQLQTTDTMKVIKYHLQSEGVSPMDIKDSLYRYAPISKTYVPLTMWDYPHVLD
ncbi:MAG: putative long chain acyl-CoA synthase [Candidatus Magnetoglobus multicellularis str. Araruama]|uniref:Putative long chain acyl-CoA synthase n=1 Tax=Candidatus Magnetoglobus multicellularis str. Araruama TaxID=890399 RepID=A0A1V1PBY0_9BACT|nr:MAG: putative long chain acyl-CoA synthase [Candidatus Magnetoglobus multicellularis str. Araruama]